MLCVTYRSGLLYKNMAIAMTDTCLVHLLIPYSGER